MEGGNPSWHGGHPTYQTGFTIFCRLKDLDESPSIFLKIKMSTRTFHWSASLLPRSAKVCRNGEPTEDKAPPLRMSITQVGEWTTPASQSLCSTGSWWEPISTPLFMLLPLPSRLSSTPTYRNHNHQGPIQNLPLSYLSNPLSLLPLPPSTPNSPSVLCGGFGTKWAWVCNDSPT